MTPTLLPMFLKSFTNKHNKVNLIIEELTTEDIIHRIRNGQLDAAIVATPLLEQDLIESVLYYEPFVGYVPEEFRESGVKEITTNSLDLKNLLLLQDGHCFRDGILNICKNDKFDDTKSFKIESGSFETLVKLSNEGFGYTLLPYLHTLNLNDKDKKNLINFSDPKPAREISLIYSQNELKIQIIKALQESILGIIRGAIAFHNVEIISPKKQK